MVGHTCSKLTHQVEMVPPHGILYMEASGSGFQNEIHFIQCQKCMTNKWTGGMFFKKSPILSCTLPFQACHRMIFFPCHYTECSIRCFIYFIILIQKHIFHQGMPTLCMHNTFVSQKTSHQSTIHRIRSGNNNHYFGINHAHDGI